MGDEQQRMAAYLPHAGGGSDRHHAGHIPITWNGSPWGLTGLSFLNTLFAIMTLGIYGFWGRTEVRKRIWSSIHLADEPLAYTGTGKELFLGFLIVFGVVLLPTLAMTLGSLFAFGPHSMGNTITQIVIAVVFVFLGGVALYRARRYRLARTNWRGIRGSLEGSSWAFGWTNFWTMMIVPAVAAVVAGGFYLAVLRGQTAVPPAVLMQQYWFWFIGAYFLTIVFWLLLVPWRTTKLNRHITNEMAFGSRPFAFTGSSRPLYLRFVARWVGVLILAVSAPAALYFWIGQNRMGEFMAANAPGGKPVPMTTREFVGFLIILAIAFLIYTVITAWYKAAEANYFASVTSYEGQPFKLSVTALGLIGLVLVNTLITIFSLGILRPVAMARTARYFVSNFALDGPVDVRAIAQSQAAMSKTGEGLAQAFDVDAF